MKIDIAKVIRDKNPKLLKIIPPFIIRWLGRLIHQEEINDALEKYGHKKGEQFASDTLKELGIKYKVVGQERVDLSKRYIVVSNHPLGGLDGIVMIEFFSQLFGNVKFVVNDLLYHVEPLKPIFIPVNKYGRQSTETAKMVQEEYSSDTQILYFPAGICSRKIDGKIQDPEWRASYINQAIKYKRDILPIFFDGKNSPSFYRIANIREKLRIKFNFETVLLPKEMFKKRGEEFTIFIGEPFSYEELTSYKNRRELNRKIRERVYSLKSDKR